MNLNRLNRSLLARLLGLALWVLTAKVCGPPAAYGMELDLGSATGLIQVTPQYSNSVLSAVLPYFSEVAEKLNLPTSHPLTRTDVAYVHILPFGGVNASIILKDGWSFDYQFGYLHQVASSQSYFTLQNPDEIPKYYARDNIDRNKAIRLAKNALEKLGIRLRDVFADEPPQVTLPEQIGTNTLPYYKVTWLDPRGFNSVEIGINGNTKRIERIYLLNKNLHHPLIRVDFPPPEVRGRGFFASRIPPPMNPAYAHKLIPIMFKAIEEYSQKLDLPVPLPLTTNNVAKVVAYNNDGWPHCEIELTNGWRFIYRHCMVCGYYAPDDLLSDQRSPAIHVEHFSGQWRLTESQAIQVVRQAMSKLDYPTNNVHMDFAPSVIYPAGYFKKIIPHYFFEWDYAPQNELQSKVEAEVNADNGRLESLYYDDKAYWNSRPPIDVPISLQTK